MKTNFKKICHCDPAKRGRSNLSVIATPLSGGSNLSDVIKIFRYYENKF